jgi:dolichol-phosphate mannosyltransferase
MKISLVIAVYNNEGAITKTYEQVSSLFKSKLPLYDFEVLFVNDGSVDNSWQEILGLRKLDDRVKAISFTRNFGQMAAMMAGFKNATGDAVINISADLQDPVELMVDMVKKWEGGSEIVIANRTDRSDPIHAKLFSRFAYSLLRISLPQMPEGGFDYVLMDRKVMDEFNAIDVRHRFFQGDLLWTGYSTCFIPYVRQKRTIGRSQYNFWKKLKNFIDATLDVSYLPIRFISFAGVAISFLGLIYCLTIVYKWFLGETPFVGWAPIMITVLLIGGLIMIMLGVIGEYVWRINEEVRKRPNYVVREKCL